MLGFDNIKFPDVKSYEKDDMGPMTQYKNMREILEKKSWTIKKIIHYFMLKIVNVEKLMAAIPDKSDGLRSISFWGDFQTNYKSFKSLLSPYLI